MGRISRTSSHGINLATFHFDGQRNLSKKGLSEGEICSYCASRRTKERQGKLELRGAG